MDLRLYIKGVLIDLFEDEKVSLNLSVKNISDISKLFTDFSQSFTIPCTPKNNSVFEYWFDSDIDGTFNSNIRVEAYIEINSLPFRYGVVQLENCKLKQGQPHSYSCTFYGNLTNLSDLFSEDELGSLDFSELNHTYSEAIVTDSITGDNDIADGNLYYPFINAMREMSIDSVGGNDLEDSGNSISYLDFKPAVRVLKIIEAIETKYDITFSRDFFDRSVFYNLYMLFHKDSGRIKAFGNEERLDIQTSTGNYSGGGTQPVSFLDFDYDLTNNEIEFIPFESSGGENILRRFNVYIFPEAGFENVPYKISIYRDNNLVNSVETIGNGILAYNESFSLDLVSNQTFYITISSQSTLEYTSKLLVTKRTSDFPDPTLIETIETLNTTPTSVISNIIVSNQAPEIKVIDFFNGLVKMFNLVIIPTSTTSFYIDTLDNWYSKGKTYDITRLINIDDIEIKRPDVKKKIEFKYKEAEAILGAKYFENNSIGYGDLKATYEIQGDDLQIEVPFENMLFERLTRENDGELTEIQAGFLLSKELTPVKGAPMLFYKNGFEKSDNTLYFGSDSFSFDTIWHTATEDNKEISQVTSSLNFGSDLSSYFYSQITQSLYYNFWKTYIEDLFNKKCRVLSFKCKLPISILLNLKINDKFIVRDKKYKISSINVDLTNGDANVEVFSDFSGVADTIDNIIALTVDNTDITVDTESITVDATSTYSPLYTYITDGISINEYFSTKGIENFEVKVTSAVNWSITKVDTGDDVTWFDINKLGGNKTDYVRVSINKNTSTTRQGIIRFNINGVDFDLNIIQE